MTKDEKIRRIAEWLEPKPTDKAEEPAILDSWPTSPGRAWVLGSCYEGGDELQWQPRDFFTDEAANALVLEKMLERYVAIMRKDYVRFEPTLGTYYEGSGDRKTAIAEACLRLIDTQHASGQTS